MPAARSRRIRTLLTPGFLLACAALPALAQKDAGRGGAERPPGQVVVGTGSPLRLDPRLEQAFENDGSLLWADAITVPGASFLKAHLADVNLRPGDVLRLISAGGRVVDEIRGRGPHDEGSFWALSAFGEELVLELRFQAPYAKAPFRVDQVILGDPGLLRDPGIQRSVCSPEDFDDVFCYQGEPGKWSNVHASVGVMTVAGDPATALFCSGANVSPLDYVLTNQHCITSQSDCNNSEFVFEYYRLGCNDGTPLTSDWQGFRCDQLVASKPFIGCESTLVDLDYALCSVSGDPGAAFGYARPDPVRLTDGEAIYIVQHPAGRPQEITLGSGSSVDVDGTVLRYYDTLDTDPGSSGSPIFRESDDRLVGLHHCNGCETPGTGNRGMLMADIYPEIESYLCTATVEVAPVGMDAFVQVHGDGDAVLEPGETWSFVPRLRNAACELPAMSVQGQVVASVASAPWVTVLQDAADFGDVAAGKSGKAVAPVVFQVHRDTTCGTSLSFDLAGLAAANGGPWSDALGFVSFSVGEAPRTTLSYADFASPAGWSVVHGGSGSGAAATWTSANPGNRSVPLTAPFFIADSDALGSGQTMDEQLIGPVVDCSAFPEITLQFAHHFRWYSAGLNEQCDVEIRSSATGGLWSLVANYHGGNTNGVVSHDVSALAAGQPDVQVRFHYYNALYEWWWAVDDVYLLGSNGFECDVFTNDQIVNKTPVNPGAGIRR